MDNFGFFTNKYKKNNINISLNKKLKIIQI